MAIIGYWALLYAKAFSVKYGGNIYLSIYLIYPIRDMNPSIGDISKWKYVLLYWTHGVRYISGFIKLSRYIPGYIKYNELKNEAGCDSGDLNLVGCLIGSGVELPK